MAPEAIKQHGQDHERGEGKSHENLAGDRERVRYKADEVREQHEHEKQCSNFVVVLDNKYDGISEIS